MELPVDVYVLNETPEEQVYEFVPKSFDDYLGQAELKNKLKIYTQAAKLRSEPLDHLLLFGPPGLGKTTLSKIIACVLGVGIKICSGPTLERTGDLVAILSSLEKYDVLFIDEIHRLPSNVEEILYSAMEQFKVDVIIGQGAGAKSISLPLNPFTLIGATTKTGSISAPLRSRFGIVERIDFYSDEELRAIVMQAAGFLKLALTKEAALLVAQRARGTPRIAKRILRRVRDFVQVRKEMIVNEVTVIEALAFMGIGEDGLTKIDIILLQKIVENFNGGPVGLETLASLIGEDRETVEAVYEPFLIMKGYLEKTPRGRQIPSNKLLYLKKKFMGQNLLF